MNENRDARSVGQQPRRTMGNRSAVERRVLRALGVKARVSAMPTHIAITRRDARDARGER